MKAVIDTNVLLVANGQHEDVSLECVDQCVRRLLAMKETGVTVIDDSYRILGEYSNKTRLNPPKGVGDVFLKDLLRKAICVEEVSLTELAEDLFVEFPDQALQPVFDAPDRKFAAVANAHAEKPPVLQAADCKWLDWWPVLQANGVVVDFLCPDEACTFYSRKFPDRPKPKLPG